MAFDKTPYLVTGTNDPADQVSVTYQNGLLAALETGINSAGVWVNVADYLASPRTPFVTDDLPAFNAAIAAIKAASPLGANAGGARLIIPAGVYYLSSTWTVDVAIYVQGAGSAQAGGAATLIRFGKNVDGILLPKAGTVLEGVQLWGGNVNVNGAGTITSFAAGDSPTGWGVKAQNDFVECRDVQATSFGGGGFLADADGAAQANSAVFYRCQAIYNGGHGFQFSGTDGNAGGSMFCSAIDNAGCGFLDFSFLGNAHYSNHTRGNGHADATGCNNPIGSCVYLGAAYYPIADQLVAASTTVPGTNPAVWVPFGGPTGLMREWVTGQTWILGSPYGTNPGNVNNYNCSFINCYEENSQPHSQLFGPCVILGGLMSELSANSTGGRMGGGRGGISAGCFYTAYPSGKSTAIGNAIGLSLNGEDTIWQHYDNTAFWVCHRSAAATISFSYGGGPQVKFNTNGIDLPAGKGLYSDGTKVVGARGAAVADAAAITSAAGVNAAAAPTMAEFNALVAEFNKVRTDLAATRTTLNDALARLRAATGHGLIA